MDSFITGDKGTSTGRSEDQELERNGSSRVLGEKEREEIKDEPRMRCVIESNERERERTTATFRATQLTNRTLSPNKKQQKTTPSHLG